jgi:hypothetical protein
MEREGYFTEGIHTYGYGSMLILAAISHIMCMMSNPGTASPHWNEPTELEVEALPV